MLPPGTAACGCTNTERVGGRGANTTSLQHNAAVHLLVPAPAAAACSRHIQQAVMSRCVESTTQGQKEEGTHHAWHGSLLARNYSTCAARGQATRLQGSGIALLWLMICDTHSCQPQRADTEYCFSTLHYSTRRTDLVRFAQTTVLVSAKGIW